MSGIIFALIVLIISYFAGNQIFNFLETSFTDRHIWTLIFILLSVTIFLIIKCTIKENKEESAGKILRGIFKDLYHGKKSLTSNEEIETLNKKLSKISAELERINEKLKKL